MSKSLWMYVFAGLVGIGAYVMVEVSGWEPSSAAYERIDPTVRRSPGGGGGSSFWHSGSHGGK